MTKVLVISPKGGCGKSTFCFQILAPFFFERDADKSLILDLDTENNEHKTYTRSKLFDAVELSLKNLDPTTFITKQNLIIDTGAANLASKTLKALDEINFLKKIDLFCIPMTRGKQAMSSALDIYDEIKELNESAKVCFILSDCYDEEDVPLEMQFIKFLGDKKHILSLDKEQGKFDELKKTDPQVSWIRIPSSPCLYWVSEYALTAYEFADNLTDLEQKQEQLAVELAESPENKAAYGLATYKVILAKRCRSFRKNVLKDDVFKSLEKVLG